ncbi:uncharacterized protein BJX67DRAFT_381980 [Aspergillus lucknowensis]|uniref:Rootletin n=1 Tax=Aspergillus lucknowensis TaxID=176173 RepID=A0ABR4LPW2_9EURO
MENNDASAVSTEGPPPDPGFDGNGYDCNEELLLLQIMDTTNQAASPNLEAVLDDRQGLDWPSGQRQQSPLLMERPQSSGIDTTAFSFAKPVQNSKPFSLQLTSRTCSSATVSQEGSGKNGLLACDKPNGEQNNQARSTASPGPAIIGLSGCVHNEEKSPAPSEQMQHSHSRNTLSAGAENRTRSDSRNAAECQKSQTQLPGANPERNRQGLPFGYGMQEGAESLITSHTNEDSPTHELKNGEKTHERIRSPENPGREGDILPELRSPHNQSRVVKRHPSDKRRATTRVSRVLSDQNLQIPEEVLFQQLISRMKAREESEAAASHLRKEMEASLSILQEENKTLRDEVQKIRSKLRQRTTEARSYKSQTDSWRSKLAKIKNFLNELGADYQNLRGEAIHLKATRKSLDKERKDIAENLEDVKARLLEVSQASCDRRGRLLESEGLIGSLRQELKYAQERAQYSQDQLADEKKRSHLLELYIQNCSRAQGKKLDLIQAGQLEMKKKVESAFEATTKNCKSSHTIISDAIEKNVDELLSLVRGTVESILHDKMDVPQIKETLCAFELRMDSAAHQIAKDVEKNVCVTDKALEGVKAQLQLFRDSVSDGSALLTQLSTSRDQCTNLQIKINETFPAFENLDLSIQRLRERQTDLGQRMERLGTDISEVKLPERFGEDYVHISEKLRLENEIQQLSLKLKLKDEELETQRLDSIQNHDRLLEMNAQAHQAEMKATKFESHTVDLQAQLEASQTKAREELDREIGRCRDLCKAEFDQQLHELALEKTTIEVDKRRLNEQLAGTQSRMAEIEDATRKQRKDLESLLAEREKRIRDLEASRTEYASRFAKQEAEVVKLREQEAALESQQLSLQNELSEANRRSNGFENELTRAIAEKQRQLQALQDSFSSLQSDFQKKEDEWKALNKELEDANTARTDLETGKSKAKAEFHALLRRVQGSESTVEEVKEMLHRLDIAQFEEPLSESLARLEASMQSANASQAITIVQDPTRDESSRVDHGTQTFEDMAQIGTETREPIPPVHRGGGLSPSGQAGAIVPFSSILQELSPAHDPIVGNEQFDITYMLTQTPERNASAEELTVPARPEKDTPFADIVPQSRADKPNEPRLNRAASMLWAASDCTQEQTGYKAAVDRAATGINESVTGRRVSVETRKLTAEADSLQVPDSQENNAQPNTREVSLGGDKPARTNRWTYSKRQRETSTKQQDTIQLEISSQIEGQQAGGETGKSKKARVSSTPPNSLAQARAGPELYDRRKSPTSPKYKKVRAKDTRYIPSSM